MLEDRHREWLKFGPGTNAPAQARPGRQQGWKAPLLCNDVEPVDQQNAGTDLFVYSPVEHLTGTRSILFDRSHGCCVRVVK